MKKSIYVIFLVSIAITFFAPATLAATKYQLRLATTVTDPHPWYQGAEYMAERVSKLTNGDVTISIHGGGALGNENAIINGMRLGSIDLMILSFTPLASIIPEGAVFCIPYIFSGYEHNARVMETGSHVFQLLEKYTTQKKLGIKLLATGGGGARCYLNMQGPIVVPDDMKGLKLRTVVNAMTKKIWSAVGAVPMAVSATEAYSAMQTGVCNSVEASLSFFNSARLCELAKYLALSNHEFVVTNISVSEATLKKLPKEYQQAIAQAAREAGSLVTEIGLKMDQKTIELMVQKDGIKTNEIDRDAFLKVFLPLQDELAKTLPGTKNGMELLSAIRAAAVK